MAAVTGKIGAAVVSFNTRELTLQCLKATQLAAAGCDTMFTLVDNGSSDGTVEAVRRAFPAWKVVVAPENPGYGAALNRAFRLAPAEFYLALNADVLLHRDAMRCLRDFLDQHPTCGLVGPSLTYPDGRLQPSAKQFPALAFAVGEALWFHSFFPRNRSVRRFYYAEQDLTNRPWVDMVSGAAMLIRAQAFWRIGGFDEGFRLYFEETDLCWRLRSAGFSIARCSEAKAVHWHGASTIQTTVRQVEYYLSYIRFFRKHHGAWSARVLAAAVAIRTLARMGGLLLKYPPLSRRDATLLGPKLAACLRLLGTLWRSTTGHQPAEVHL